MVKVALCLSGQPRRALDTFTNIYENIIKPNNADVFIHMHYDKTKLHIEKNHMDNGKCTLEPELDDQLIELYKPIKFLIESPRNFKKPNCIIPENRLKNVKNMNLHKNFTDDECTNHFIKQLTSMYYSIYKCNELKEVYANEQGIVYDYVIRIRFDFLPKQPFICQQLDPNYIHYLELGQPDNLISDWFNVGSNLIMNIYASLYLHMDYLNTFLFFKQNQRLPNTLEPSDICGGMAEHQLRDLMTLFHIPKKPIHLDSQILY